MKIDGIIAQSLASLDQESWRRLRIFGCKLPLVVLFAVVFAAPHGYSLAGALAFFFGWQAAFAALQALLQRHSLSAGSLTAWDETVAFLGLAVLMHLVGALAS
jgi:hypothetical protein